MLNKMRIRVMGNVLGHVTCCLLVFGITATPVFCVAQESPKLKIVVMAGDGATNNIKLRLNRELIVKVEDENNNPVAGVSVVFTLPDSGAGGTFQGVGKMLAVQSNQEGIAAAKNFIPNKIVGDFQIQVQASQQGQVSTTTIAQSNVVIGKAVSGALLGVIIGAAAATAVTAVTLIKKDDPKDTIIKGKISLEGDPTIDLPGTP